MNIKPRKMQFCLLAVGAIKDAYLQEGMALYAKRIGNYCSFMQLVVPTAEKLETALKPGDFLVLLDEYATSYGSVDFSKQMQRWMNSGPKRMVFAVGDAYGFPASFRGKANASVALGPMTMTHDMVRLVFAEQLYRAWTLLKNEPYHHA